MAGKGSGKDESEKQTDEVSASAKAYAELFGTPPKKATVTCFWCDAEVPDVKEHIGTAHPKFTVGDYIKEFKNARLLPDTQPALPPAPQSPRPRPIAVTSKEARRHPGGRDAALIEKQIDPRDQSAYRDYVRELVEVKGYPKGYMVANLAYDMLEAARFRVAAEEARAKQRDVKGTVIADTAAKEQLRKIEAGIEDTLETLEKARLAKLEEDRMRAAEDPLAIVNDALLEAERWVRENQGEFVEACPGCGQMLTPPALPHWAFEPLLTESGKEWPVWSTEGFELVRRRELRLSQLCLILRTSPEGLKMTAQRRGESWPDFIVLEQEERELRRYLNAADDAALLSAPVSVRDEPTDMGEDE